MLVTAVRGHNFRCYERVEIGFAPGLVGIVGPNGAGKTSLVEMIHFGALAYSPRTTGEAQMIAFGHDFTRVALEAGLRVASATVSRPSLDDVYLRHTGRTFARAQDGFAPDDEEKAAS